MNVSSYGKLNYCTRNSLHLQILNAKSSYNVLHLCKDIFVGEGLLRTLHEEFLDGRIFFYRLIKSWIGTFLVGTDRNQIRVFLIET